MNKSDLHRTDNTQPLLLQHDSKITTKENHMDNREEETSNQSLNTTDDENKCFELLEFEDIPNLDRVALESAVFNCQIQDEFTVSGLEQKLINGMAKLKVDDMDQLSEKIQQTKERIKGSQEEDEEETDKEIQLLTQLKHLTLLDDTITKLKSTESVEDNSRVMELYRLQQNLVNELGKLKVDGVTNLSEKIQQTKTRMNGYRKDDRQEEIKKQMEIWTQMKHLTLLDDTITKLETTESVEESNTVIEVCWLGQEVINRLVKLKIVDIDTLPGKIQETEKELARLKYLTLVNGTTTEVKSTGSTAGSSNFMNSLQLRQELVSGLTKFI